MNRRILYNHRTPENSDIQKIYPNSTGRKPTSIWRKLSITVLLLGTFIISIQTCAGTTTNSTPEKIRSPEASPFYELYDQSYKPLETNSTPVKSKGVKK